MAATMNTNVNEEQVLPKISGSTDLEEMDLPPVQPITTAVEAGAEARPSSPSSRVDSPSLSSCDNSEGESAATGDATNQAVSIACQAGGADSQDSRESSPDGAVDSAASSDKLPKSTPAGEQPQSAKARKKEDKSIEHILRALNSLSTSEEKLAALCKKYSDLLDEHRLLQNKFKQNQRKLSVIVREKEHLQSEHSKAILAKSKLESLCRELQRHNKLVKEESLARARDEEEKRKEITGKFQSTINDIQAQMNDHYAKNTKLREENVELANKLKNLIEQYELREQHIEKIFKHKDLEQQLVDAKLAQANLQLHEDKEKNIKEKQELLQDAVQAQEKINMLEGQEKQLRAQVALYTEKYEEFQTTLAKSNEVFQTFKSEMDKMTKKIKKLEKDTTMWRTRWENSNKALLDMAEEKTRSDKEISTLQQKIQRLEKLCRALQAERHKGPSNTQENDVSENAKNIEPTKTPPNTPDGGSRNSPEPGTGDTTVKEVNSNTQTSVTADNEPAMSENPREIGDTSEKGAEDDTPTPTACEETSEETSEESSTTSMDTKCQNAQDSVNDTENAGVPSEGLPEVVEK